MFTDLFWIQIILLNVLIQKRQINKNKNLIPIPLQNKHSIFVWNVLRLIRFADTICYLRKSFYFFYILLPGYDMSHVSFDDLFNTEMDA